MNPINPDVVFGWAAVGLAMAVFPFSETVAIVGLGVIVVALAIAYIGLLLEDDRS